MTNANLPSTLARFAARRLGEAAGVHTLGEPGGNATVHLWQGSRGVGVIKAYRSSRTYRQELHAYRTWLNSVGDVPRLLAVHEQKPFALLLERIDGRPLARASLPPRTERAAHRRAAAWLRELHALPFRDDDPKSLADAYRARLGAWIVRSGRVGLAVEGHSPPAAGVELAGWLTGRLERTLPRLEDAVRVPCHRDWEPRNWLVDDEGVWVAAIDFEHARPDHPLADLSRLAAYVWPGRPDLKAACEEGWGTPWDDRDLEAIVAFAALDAAQRLFWARDHGDVRLLESAIAALTALGAPVSGLASGYDRP